MLFLGPFGLAKMMLIEQPNLSAYSFQSHPLDQILGYTSKGRRSGYSIGLSSSGIYGYENLCKVTLLLICPPYSVRLKLMCFLSYNSGWLCRGQDICIPLLRKYQYYGLHSYFTFTVPILANKFEMHHFY